MFQGYYNQQEEQGFPWQQSEHQHGHHGHHGHHGPHFGGPRGPWAHRHGYGRGPQFDGPRGPWAYGRGPQFGGPQFGGPRGPWAHRHEHGHGHGPHFAGPRAPWMYGRGPQFGGPQFGGPLGFWGRGFGGYNRPEITPEQQALRSTAGEVFRLFALAVRNSMGNADRRAQLKSFLERIRTDLQQIVGDTNSAPQQESQQGEQTNVEQA